MNISDIERIKPGTLLKCDICDIAIFYLVLEKSMVLSEIEMFYKWLCKFKALAYIGKELRTQTIYIISDVYVESWSIVVE